MATANSGGPAAVPPRDHNETTRILAANETTHAFIGGRRHSWMMASVPVLDAVPNTTDELVKRKRQRRMSTGGRVTNKSMVRNKVPGTLGTDPVPCKQSKSPKGCKLAQERRRNVPTIASDNQIIPQDAQMPAMVPPRDDGCAIVSPAPSPGGSDAQISSPSGQSGTAAARHVERLNVPLPNGMGEASRTGVTLPEDAGESRVDATSGTSKPTLPSIVGDASHDGSPPHQLPDRRLTPNEPYCNAVFNAVCNVVSNIQSQPEEDSLTNQNEASPTAIGDNSLQHQPVTTPSHTSADICRVEIDRWRYMISERVKEQGQSTSRQQDNFLEQARYHQLYDACQKQDAFFVILHQLFCLWSWDRVRIHANIAMDQQLLDAAFWQLNVLLRPNTDMAQDNLHWFISFPFNDDDSAGRFPLYRHIYSGILNFLVSLVHNLTPMLIHIQARGYPILVAELRTVFNCPSPQLQEVLFTVSRRHLLASDERLAVPLHQLFEFDQRNEASTPAAGRATQLQSETRNQIVARYITLIGRSSVTSTSPWLHGDSGPPTDAARQQRSAHNQIGPLNPVLRSNAAVSLTSGHISPLTAAQETATTLATQLPSVYAMPPRRTDPRSVRVRQFISQQSSGNSPGLEQPSREGHVEGGSNYSLATNPNLPSRSSQTLDPAVPRTFHHHQMRLNQAIVGAGPAASTNVSRTVPQTLQPRFNRPQNHQFTTSVISATEYPHDPYDWTSVQNSLHLVRQRSPQREYAGKCTKRHYQFVHKLMEAPIDVSSRPGIQTFKFLVTDDHLAGRSQLVCPGGIQVHQYGNGSLRYRLRFSKPDNHTLSIQEANWADCPTSWPAQVYIMFNGEPIFPRRQNHFHIDLPIEITQMIKKGENVVKTSVPQTAEALNNHEAYFMAVETVVTMDHDSIISMVSMMDRIHVKHTLAEVKQRLQPADSDDVIAQDDTLTVSVADPFSASVIRTPVRGLLCKHLECFDLELWLQTRRGKRSESCTEPSIVDGWKCPICGHDARPCSLRIDEYFTGVIKDLASNDNVQTKKITISRDGSWVAVRHSEDDGAESKQTPSQNSPKKALRRDEVIEILDD